MKIRAATHADVEIIIRWRQEAAEWLAARGSDQWSDVGLGQDAFRQRVASSIAAGETWMAIDADGNPLGTIAIDKWSDADLWSEDELHDAVIVHRMITAPGHGGRGVGDLLLDHAVDIARSEGRMFVRLDAWTTNQGLHRYYRSRGFRHVRTIPGHVSPSAALFERPVGLPDTPRCGGEQAERRMRKTS